MDSPHFGAVKEKLLDYKFSQLLSYARQNKVQNPAVFIAEQMNDIGNLVDSGAIEPTEFGQMDSTDIYNLVKNRIDEALKGNVKRVAR